MAMTLKLPTRAQVGTLLHTVHEAMESLPRDSATLLESVISRGVTLAEGARELGVSESHAAGKFATTLCAICRVVYGTNEDSFDGKATSGEALVFGRGNWPMLRLPRDGSVEAQVAAAEYFEATSRRHEAVPLLVRAAHTEKHVVRNPDALDAHWNAARVFLDLAEGPDVVEADRETFLCSAERYLQHARAIAETVSDRRRESELVYDIIRVCLGQGDIAMARTYGEIGDRAAKAVGNDALRGRMHLLFVQWNADQARVLLAQGDVVEAEECAKRALSLCVSKKVTGQCEAVYQLLDEINGVVTRSDRIAREQQLAALCNTASTVCAEAVLESSPYEVIRRAYVQAETLRQSDRPAFERDQI